jgi:hypothetical protein
MNARVKVKDALINRFERLTFFRAQPDDVLPDLDLWHDPIPGNVDDVA